MSYSQETEHDYKFEATYSVPEWLKNSLEQDAMLVALQEEMNIDEPYSGIENSTVNPDGSLTVIGHIRGREMTDMEEYMEDGIQDEFAHAIISHLCGRVQMVK